MPLYLDTETTGLSASAGDAIVEVAIVDSYGNPVLNTLVNPGRPIPWQATQVHGISESMVRGRPTLNSLMPRIRELIAGELVVIYNSSFDLPFFPGRLEEAWSVQCAMRRFTQITGGGRWKSLEDAARTVGHQWTGKAHRALADTLACKSVWDWCTKPSTSLSSSVAVADLDEEQFSQNYSSFPCPKCTATLTVSTDKRQGVSCRACRRTFYR